MKYKNRILHVMGALNIGGQETLAMNIYRNIDREKLQFDFSVVSKDNGYYEEEINNLGGKVYHIVSSGENRYEYFKQMYKLFKKYDVVHIHTSSAKIIFLVWLAKLAKCKKIIVHSHNTSCNQIMLHKITRTILQYMNIIRIACGEEAGKWMFKNREFTIIYNGIDVNQYKFNKEIRNKKRKELKIENEYVIGNVGRFSEQKNQKRLIKIFVKIAKDKENTKLLLIGNGKLEEEIRKKIAEENIEDSVIILKDRNDINELLQAMDVFVLTSKYEGLSVALIEAQASGLPIVASNNIDKESDITNLIHFVSLEDEDQKWINKIYNSIKQNINRKSYNEIVRKSNYNIEDTTNKILKIYGIYEELG